VSGDVIALGDGGPGPFTMCNTSASSITASSGDDAGDYCLLNLLPSGGTWTGSGSCVESGETQAIQTFTMWLDGGRLDYTESNQNGAAQVNGSCIKE
jgi:hypothetical protein